MKRDLSGVSDVELMEEIRERMRRRSTPFPQMVSLPYRRELADMTTHRYPVVATVPNPATPIPVESLSLSAHEYSDDTERVGVAQPIPRQSRAGRAMLIAMVVVIFVLVGLLAILITRLPPA